MRRSGSRTILLLGAVVAIAVALVIFLLMNGGGNANAQAQPTPTPVIIKVVAPKSDIKQFTILTNDNLGLVDVNESSVPTTTLHLVNQESVGKMVLRDYKANEPVVTTDLQDPGVPQLLDKGKRAFAVAVQEINTFNQSIIANDSIDLIWSRKFIISAYTVPPGGGTAEKVEREEWSTKTLLQNIKVLRVVSLRTTASNGTTNGVNSSSQSGNDPSKADQALQAQFAATAPPTMVLILSVDDQQAEVIKFARENGLLDVALRATGDDEPGTTSGITDQILVNDYKVVVPELIVK
jgi:Flp pilus assembly protein CpaB